MLVCVNPLMLCSGDFNVYFCNDDSNAHFPSKRQIIVAETILKYYWRVLNSHFEEVSETNYCIISPIGLHLRFTPSTEQ